MVYPYSGALFGHKKKQSSDILYNMDEPWKHYAKWKKSGMKGQMLDFPGSSVDKTSPSNAGVVGLIPGQGAKIPHASWPKKPKHKTEAIL